MIHIHTMSRLENPRGSGDEKRISRRNFLRKGSVIVGGAGAILAGAGIGYAVNTAKLSSDIIRNQTQTDAFRIPTDKEVATARFVGEVKSAVVALAGLIVAYVSYIFYKNNLEE